MPKDRRIRSLSFDGARASPYPCSSKNADRCKSKILSLPLGDEKEWEEARCPICMEHPHNAVLLLCSSRERGCRPYMCDTSYRHSNCLDQFCKSSTAAPSTSLGEEVLPSSTAYPRGSDERTFSQATRFRGRLQPKLVCPLCRGQINGWTVIEPARRFMNSKSRSCSLETCEFSGNYSELRRHARLEHPSVRPSEADPRRQHDWTSFERQRDFEDIQRDFEDVLSAHHLQFGDDLGEDSILLDHDWMEEIDRDLEDFLTAFQSESEEEWSENSNLLMDFECDLRFPFLGVFSPPDPWFGTSEW